MKLLTYVSCLVAAGLLANSAIAQTKDPELNKCISFTTQIEQDLGKLEAGLNAAQKKEVSDRRIKAVNAYQAVRPRTLASCRTYQGTINTIKMDIQNKRLGAAAAQAAEQARATPKLPLTNCSDTTKIQPAAKAACEADMKKRVACNNTSNPGACYSKK